MLIKQSGSDINTWRKGRLTESKSIVYADIVSGALISKFQYRIYKSGAQFITLQLNSELSLNNFKPKLAALSLEYLASGTLPNILLIRIDSDQQAKVREFIDITANEFEDFHQIKNELIDQIFNQANTDINHKQSTEANHTMCITI